VAAIGGRGGGRGDLAQGGGDAADRLDEALSSAARAIRGDAAGA
jgi:alanyl-tRNA synthetase